MKKLIISLATFLFVLLLAPTNVSNAGGQPVVTFEVTVTNLTDGQPFSPPILATHRAGTNFFTVGDAASAGIMAISENGDNSVLQTALDASSDVYASTQGTAPLVPASNPGGTPFGSSATYTIQASNGAKFLSVAMMLICTNDGFTGIDTIHLPKVVGQTDTYHSSGYDAGTEMNTEDFADIVPPCQGLIGVSSEDAGTGMSNPALAEGGVITHHAGIQGGDDLVPGVHGWSNPVVMIEITRVD